MREEPAVAEGRLPFPCALMPRQELLLEVIYNLSVQFLLR